MSDDHDIFMLLALRDNILHTFFQILWEKCRSRSTLSTVRIPDTIIFSHSRVADWFFTSRDGAIRKKGHMKLSSANVLEQFEKKAKKNKSAVVALLLERDLCKEDGLKSRHMDIASVRQFLGEGGGSGTLQHFIEPKPDSGAVHNCEIALSWTPNVFYVEKKTNMSDMSREASSKGSSLDDRATVEETAKNVHVAPLVSTRITAELEAMCQDIALHTELVFGVRLANLGLHCKVDMNDQLWVLFCTSLRVVALGAVPRSISVTLLQSKSNSGAAAAVEEKKSFARERSSRSPVKLTEQPSQAKLTSASMHQHSTSMRNTDRSSSPPLRHVASLEYTDSQTSEGGSSHASSASPPLNARKAPLKKMSFKTPLSAEEEGSADGGEIFCDVCLKEMEKECRIVPKRHVLFPLSLISFFASNPPGTRYVDVVESSRVPSSVPEFVRVLHPDITLEEYRLVRREKAWLSESVKLCDECAEGLKNIVESLELERDGSICVPRPKQTAPLPAARRVAPLAVDSSAGKQLSSRTVRPARTGSNDGSYEIKADVGRRSASALH